MGLFTKNIKEETVIISKKSFADQLADVKSVFKKAYDDAMNVSEQCTNHITKKQVEIKEIETEIKATEKVKEEATTFMSKLKDLV